jgi:two-component system response regulator YesN
MKILLVDDEYYFRKAFQNLLMQTDPSLEVVAEACNGKDALQYMQDVDLVFLDINIPVLNGIEVLSRSRERDDHCAIIMVTVYAEFDYVKKAIRLGALDYILKPIDKEELIRVIKKAKAVIDSKKSDQHNSIEISDCKGLFFAPASSQSREDSLRSLSMLRLDFLMDMRSGSLEKCQALIECCIPSGVYSPDDIYIIMIEIISMVIEFCNENSIAFHNEGITMAALQVLVSSAEIGEIYAWLTALVSDCIEKYLEKKKISPNRNQLIEDIMQYIAEHYSSPTLSVSTIAHAFSFNYHYLSKLFSQQTCINIKKYITKIRIHKAKEIIDTGSCSLQEVCFLVGYEDPSYFSKCFKAFYGVTPSQYVETRRRL